MYPFLLEIGPIKIASYGTMVALGFLVSLYFLNKDLKRRGLDPELGSSLITAAMIGGLVGAKLYYVLFELTADTWEEIISATFSGSGLTWYGGFVVALASVAWVIKRHKAPLLLVADAMAPAAALGYGIGRIGCQLAGDGDYGVPTDLPWAMAYPNGVVPTLEKVHPAPVYETLMGVALFGGLWAGRLRVQTPGMLASIYLVFAGLARFLVEIIRVNPKVLFGLSGAQLISIGLVGLGIFGIIYLSRTAAEAGDE